MYVQYNSDISREWTAKSFNTLQERVSLRRFKSGNQIFFCYVVEFHCTAQKAHREEILSWILQFFFLSFCWHKFVSLACTVAP